MRTARKTNAPHTKSSNFEILLQLLQFSLKRDNNQIISGEIYFSIILTEVALQYEFRFQLKYDTPVL